MMKKDTVSIVLISTWTPWFSRGLLYAISLSILDNQPLSLIGRPAHTAMILYWSWFTVSSCKRNAQWTYPFYPHSKHKIRYLSRAKRDLQYSLGINGNKLRLNKFIPWRHSVISVFSDPCRRLRYLWSSRPLYMLSSYPIIVPNIRGFSVSYSPYQTLSHYVFPMQNSPPYLWWMWSQGCIRKRVIWIVYNF